MMVTLSVVASGADWSLCQNPDGPGLILIFDKPTFVARPHQVEVTLPPNFVTEFLQQKREIRQVSGP